jgi:hypothetical protein
MEEALHYLAIVSMFRNEAGALAEWVAFHLLHGVEHLFLYDNCSNDGSLAEIEVFIQARRVTVMRWEDMSDLSQNNMYVDALHRYRSCAKWLAFIDVDEFLFSPTGMSLPLVLERYEPYPGVVAHWHVYGSSGLLRRRELVVDSFTRRAPTEFYRNLRVKSIVDPSCVSSPLGAHFFDFGDGRLAVNEVEQPVAVILGGRDGTSGARDPFARRHASVERIYANVLRINHYAVKSREEYDSKRERFAHRTYASERFADYWSVHDRNDVEDCILADMGGRVSYALTHVWIS